MKNHLYAAAIGVTAALTALPALSAPAAPSEYSPVTDARLKNPEPGNWLQYRGNYGGWGYSPLDKVNVNNVGKLQLAWSLSTGQTEGHQAPPIVNNGFMYVTTPGAQVIAIEAKSGREIWRYKKEIPAEMLQLHPTNRGVALYGDKVYVATVDCHLVALDAETGKVLWIKQVGDWKALQYMTLANTVRLTNFTIKFVAPFKEMLRWQERKRCWARGLG